MATYILTAVLVILTVLAVKNVMDQKKSGRSISCGGDCSSCPMAPYESEAVRKQKLKNRKGEEKED